MYKHRVQKVNYSEVTDKIIRIMEKGILPCGSQWESGRNKSLPFNLATSNCYHGINIVTLWVRELEMEYTSNGWITINQLRTIGQNDEIQIRLKVLPEDTPGRAPNKTGQTGIQVFHAGNFIPGEWKAESEGGMYRSDKTGEYKNQDQVRLSYLKVAGTVFNLDQIENLPEKYQVFDELLPLADREPEITIMTNSYGVPINVSKNGKCYYRPSIHEIFLVHQEQFKSAEDFERVKFHELVHSTGHKSLLGRSGIDRTNGISQKGYAEEELVAELGAAFLCAEYGIPGLMVHAEYLKHYINVLKNNNRAIFKAASQAQTAVELLMSHTPQAKQKAA